jgi:hypothetical protein
MLQLQPETAPSPLAPGRAGPLDEPREAVGHEGQKGLDGAGSAKESGEGLRRQAVQQCAEVGTVAQGDPQRMGLLPDVEELLENGWRYLAGPGPSESRTGVEGGLQVKGIVLDGRA